MNKEQERSRRRRRRRNEDSKQEEKEHEREKKGGGGATRRIMNCNENKNNCNENKNNCNEMKNNNIIYKKIANAFGSLRLFQFLVLPDVVYARPKSFTAPRHSRSLVRGGDSRDFGPVLAQSRPRLAASPSRSFPAPLIRSRAKLATHLETLHAPHSFQV